MEGKQVTICGEVRSVKELKSDGKIFMRQYQIEVMAGQTDVSTMVVCDYDLDRIFKIGQITPVLPVRPAISDFRNLHIEFHVIKNGNGNKSAEKEKPAMKV